MISYVEPKEARTDEMHQQRRFETLIPLSLEASPTHGEIAFVLSTPNLINIGWTEFAQAPRKYHLMEGIMEAKKEEFRKTGNGYHVS